MGHRNCEEIWRDVSTIGTEDPAAQLFTPSQVHLQHWGEDMGISELVESGQRLDGEAIRDILVTAVYAYGIGNTLRGQSSPPHAVRGEVADAPSYHARHFEQAERTYFRAVPRRGIQTPAL